LSAADIASLLADAEVEYLQAEVPVAIRQTLEGIERIGSIVQSMKELTDPVPDFVPANLNPVIESAVNAARNEWADIAGFDMQLDPQLPWVQCQPESINQVVVCMLANAAQAIAEADEGRKAHGHIVVRTRSAANRVEISISDDGIGMTPAVQARIFDPFFSTRPVGKGTGQSLGVAHSVIRRHGGTIAVDSTPGRGSCFRISLPLAEGQRSSGGHQDPQLLRNTDRLAG
jgi:signal transduction histidine kinase